MANKSSSKYLTGTDANDHHRTTTGRDLLRLGNLPTTTLLTIEISETATVDIEYSEDGTAFIKVATITETSGVQFAIPASILSVHVTQYTSGFVRVLARTVVLDNIPSQTLLIYSGATVTSPIIQSADHGNLTGLGDDDHTQYVLADGSRTMTGAIDLTGIAAGSPSAKIIATSDTPTVAFTDSGAANHAPTTAPAGYVEILVGGVARYIPFWA